MAASLGEELIAAVAHAEARKVVIDWEHVEYLTSANFRPFLALRKHLQEVGGRMVLCNLSEVVRDSFQGTQLTGLPRPSSAIFEVQPHVPAAAASLARDPQHPPPSRQRPTSGYLFRMSAT